MSASLPEAKGVARNTKQFPIITIRDPDIDQISPIHLNSPNLHYDSLDGLVEYAETRNERIHQRLIDAI